MVNEHIIQYIAGAICRIVAQGATGKGDTIPRVTVDIPKGHLLVGSMLGEHLGYDHTRKYIKCPYREKSKEKERES